MEVTGAVKPIPEGYHTVAPYLLVNGASDLLQFLKEAFGAEQVCLFRTDDGKRIRHAEVRIGDSIVMVADASDSYPPMPAMIHLYVSNADRVHEQALKAGATSLREPADQPFGERISGLRDAWGNQWWTATRIEDLTREEITQRAENRSRKKE